MKRKARILIIDDEPNIRKILQAAFERSGLATVAAETGEEALEKFKAEPFDIVLTDVFMPGISGVTVLQQIKETNPEVPVIIMTAFGTIPQAVEAMRLGAADYISKPFDLEHLKKVVAFWIRASSGKSREPVATTDSTFLEGIVYESEAMVAAVELVKKVSDSRVTVLITGESGVGKEVLAKALHKLSSRASAPFVAINCAAIPETLLESELFGYEKGAFTGADVSRPGKFEAADGGTLFLDEIGELPVGLQVKLLRVLQEREFERLGSTTPTKVDVRLIAATNRDLNRAVAEGSFRQDLLYRLQVIQIDIPPLRERIEDIEPLARLFLQRFARANRSSLSDIAADALADLKAYRWPGNVRELENVVERATVLAPKSATILTRDLLPPTLRSAA